MKRVLIVAVAAALAAAASATPRIAVQEDFEGSTFPPPGWTTYGEGRWYWKRVAGYAEGYARAEEVPEQSRATLASPLFSVNKGTALRVEFRYRTESDWEADHYVRIGSWYKIYLEHEWGWTKFDQVTAPFPDTGQYKAEFVIYVVPGSFPVWGLLQLDDVVITRQNVAVSPASLGRVKALFR